MAYRQILQPRDGLHQRAKTWLKGRMKSVDRKLLLLLLGAFALRLFVGLVYPNILWPDEIWQTLEQGHRFAFGYGEIPWEFVDGLRNWLLPGILGLVMRATAWMAPGSVGYMAAARLLLCVLGLIPVWAAYRWGQRALGPVAASIAGLAAASWFELVYFAPKALTEVVATHVLLAGITIGLLGSRPKPLIRYGLSGLLLGTALGLRIHLGPAIGVAALYICGRRWTQRWLPLTVGALAAVFVFGIVDAFTWSYPFQSFVNNFQVNVLQHKSYQFGTAPWWAYFEILRKVWGLGLVLLIPAVLLGARRAKPLLAVAVTVLLTHSLFAHKEYRFIYPMIPFIVTVAAIGSADMALRLRQCLRSVAVQRAATAAVVAVWIFGSAYLAQRYNTALMNPRHRNKGYSPWTVSRAPIQAAQYLSQRHNVCGLALQGIWRYSSGIFTYLHHDVPVICPRTRASLTKHTTTFNTIISSTPLAKPLAPYRKLHCWEKVCVYQRSGDCERRPAWTGHQTEFRKL